MKTVNLTIGERTKAIELLNGGKFNNSTLAVVLDDIKKFNVTEPEWVEAELVKTPNANGTETWKWDETKSLKDIELDQGTVDALTSIIKSRSDANELSLSDGAILSLGKKLEA